MFDTEDGKIIRNMMRGAIIGNLTYNMVPFHEAFDRAEKLLDAFAQHSSNVPKNISELHFSMIGALEGLKQAYSDMVFIPRRD